MPENIYIPAVVTIVIYLASLYITRRFTVHAPIVEERLYVDGIVRIIRAEYEEKIDKLKEDAKKAKKLFMDEIENLRLSSEQTQADMQRTIDFLVRELSVAKIVPLIEGSMTREDVLVVVGTEDTALKMDLMAVRRSGVRLSRLQPATKTSLETMLNRRRKNGTPIKYIHISAHAGPDGIELEDGLADPEWLADQMQGVTVLLIAGCRGDNLGDWLAGIARYVITMSEPVRNTTTPGMSDIGIFSEVFWRGIYNNRPVPVAFDEAIQMSPAWISEIAELHFV